MRLHCKARFDKYLQVWYKFGLIALSLVGAAKKRESVQVMMFSSLYLVPSVVIILVLVELLIKERLAVGRVVA